MEFIIKEFSERMGDIYQHRSKQIKFASLASEVFAAMPMFPSDLWRGVLDGNIENLKQKSMYVGLHRRNGRVDFKGKISTPMVFKRKIAMRQITAVNDYLVNLAEGVIGGGYTYDNGNIERLLNNRLLKELRRIWRYGTPANQRNKQKQRVLARLGKRLKQRQFKILAADSTVVPK